MLEQEIMVLVGIIPGAKHGARAATTYTYDIEVYETLRKDNAGQVGVTPPKGKQLVDVLHQQLPAPYSDMR